MWKIYKCKLNKGFTLIELLMVIVIIGVVSAIGLASFGPAYLQRSRDAKRKANLQQVKNALEMYRADNNTYPSSTDGYEIIGCTTCSSAATCSWGNTWSCSSNTYMVLPSNTTDTAANYRYYYDSTNKTYKVQACIEFAGDTGLDIVSSGFIGAACSSGKAYQLANP
ncbi:MAG: type II secretion system protein [Candidatus Gottesmanbacteria bacterium]